MLNADFTSNFDLYWVFLRVVGLAAFLIGTIHASNSLRFSPREEIDRFRALPLIDDLRGSVSGLIIICTIGICVMAGYLFARQIGYNAFGLSVTQLLNFGSVDRADFSALRAGATREGYAAAGYAVQFTAVLLPALILMIFLRGRLNRTPILYFVVAILAIMDLYFLTIVGGRKYLIGTVAMIILVLIPLTTPLPRGLRATKGGAAAFVVGALALFGLTTLLQGRGSGDDEPSLLRESTLGLYDRLGGDYSFYQFESVRLLRDEVPVWGAQWLDQLKTTLPGADIGLSFDARLHGLLFSGNTRGNSPLDFWGSSYYNWGALGLVLIAFGLGYLLQLFSVKYLIRSEKSLSAVVLLSWAGYRFALWRDPYSMLLEGGVTLILFYWLHSRARGRQRPLKASEQAQSNV